jgi:hypothetical protein
LKGFSLDSASLGYMPRNMAHRTNQPGQKAFPLNTPLLRYIVPSSAVHVAISAITLTLLSLSSATASGDFDVTLIPSPPRIAFPNTQKQGARFTVVTLQSTRFASVTPSDNVQIFLNEQKTGIIWKGLPNDANKYRVYGYVDTNARQIDLWLPWRPLFVSRHNFYQGTITIRIGINGQLSDVYSIIVPSFEGRWWPAAVAAVATFVIFAIPIVIVNDSRTGAVIAGRSYGLVSSLFLEPETDTYSLSRLQFYVWTAAAIFGYIILTVTQTLMQGKFVFANIPQGLPGIIFISGSTAATAQGITSRRGAKGAGPIYPTLGDFITTGGVVAVDRFQFLVWTIVGVCTFLFLTVFQSPDSLTDLPKIPDGFLALMGLSAFGYLGGRLSRKPGPIVDGITASGSLVLTFQGRKLSSHCALNVDGLDVNAQMMNPVAAREPDDQSQPPEFYKTVVATITHPDTKWLKGGRHSATLTNPDGQQAQWFYSLPSKPVLETIQVQLGGGDFMIVLTGQQLSPKATFRIDGTDLASENIVAINPGPSSDEEYQPPGETPALFTGVTLIISKPKDVLKDSDHLTLVITNPDSESTSITYLFTAPQITNVRASKMDDGIQLVVTGTQLSKDATFAIDGVPVVGAATPGEQDDLTRELFKNLTLRIVRLAKPEWATSGAFSLTNPDGRQSNSHTYP